MHIYIYSLPLIIKKAKKNEKAENLTLPKKLTFILIHFFQCQIYDFNSYTLLCLKVHNDLFKKHINFIFLYLII